MPKETKKIKKKALTKSSRRKINRPGIDEYFMKMALLVSERATCKRHSVGAVLVKNKMVLSTGYNGAAKGAKDCLERGCLRDEQNIPSGERAEICRAIHAEQNAVIQAASKGLDMSDSTLYCTHSPCIICAKIMANAGVRRVVVFEEYSDQNYKELYDEIGIVTDFMPKPKMTIDFYE